ncbi:OmpA family protein [Nitrincola alkalilacustris]|uniref:OmpA family protein n=1 Tax=Nitrincola alkalilacustris TaxID=1571224 RepID=UPI00124E831D|nr:OmpA family protein [Nitrincola alkalilacustris]
MTTKRFNLKLMTTSIVASIMLTACATTQAPDGAADVRGKLNRLQANQELASRAPAALQEAEVAVRLAETPERNRELITHRLVMADQKIDIAAALGQARLYEDQRAELIRESEAARLDSRTREADQANLDASLAREDAGKARLEATELQRQLDELKAQETDRGIVITLGDVLFATGRSELTGASNAHLAKLARFLNQYPDRTVVIEGHTDNVGSEGSNFSLSQNRALSVQAFLLQHGVASNRLRTVPMGQGSPVASNDSATGRQQNRRVEVIIENNTLTTR